MKNLLFPLIAVLLWSINAIVNKAASTAIDPAAISFYRWALAFSHDPFVLRSVLRNFKTVMKHWWQLAILGALGMMLYQSLAYYAAHSVSATFMGIMNSMIPLLTVIISIFVLRVIPTVGIVLGSILSLSGLVWLVSQGSPSALFSRLSQGEGDVGCVRCIRPVCKLNCVGQSNYLAGTRYTFRFSLALSCYTPNFLLAEDVSEQPKISV